MFVYNITVKVNNDVVEDWIEWQKEIHIPEVLATGFFYDHRFYQLLEQDESEGKTFVVQFFTLEMKDYKEYIDQHAPGLREKTFQKWGDQFVSFRTLFKSL